MEDSENETNGSLNKDTTLAINEHMSFKQQVETSLRRLGYNPEILIRVSSDAANQVIMRKGHPLAGFSVRDLLMAWNRLTGQEYEIHYDNEGE